MSIGARDISSREASTPLPYFSHYHGTLELEWVHEIFVPVKARLLP